MLIRLEQFKGIAPRLAKHLLPDNNAQTAENCRLASGSLQSWLVNLSNWTPTKSGTIQSIYLHETNYWFHWTDDDIYVCKAPIASDSYVRVYYTGDGVPKMTTHSAAVSGGGTDYPITSYNLGLPVPAVSITATPEVYSASSTYALGKEVTYSGTIYRCTTAISSPEAWTIGHWTAVDSEELETRAYTYCYVSAYGEEGPPADPSTAVICGPNQKVALSAMSTGPSGAYNVTNKRIYRTNTGSTSTEYQTVATIVVANTTYDDTVLSSALGDVMPSAEYEAPPSNLAGLVVMPGGIFSGYFGKTVCFSVPYLPHAWPTSWQIPVHDDIVGLGVYGTSLLVLTEGQPIVITGTDPSAMSIERLEIGHACVSRRGIVDMGYSVIYPSPDGLVQAGMGSFTLVTKEILTKKEWASYAPSGIHAYLYDGMYVGFYNSAAGFVFNPATGDFTTLNFYATAGYSDPNTGDLYLVVSGVIYKFDAGATRMTYTWKSKPFQAPYPVNMAVAQVFADAYNVTAKIYADGVLILTQTVTSSAPFRLPAGYLATTWEVELSGANIVNRVQMASTAKELQRI